MSLVCPDCGAAVHPAGARCVRCGARLARRPVPGEWTRKSEGRMVAGVCAGLAERFGISVTVVRLAFAIGALISGLLPAAILYAVLWIIMPLEVPPEELEAISERFDRLRGPKHRG